MIDPTDTFDIELADPQGGHDPSRDCGQRCGAPATVYAVDPHPGGWGGRYCVPCAEALRFQIVDRLS
jgi:hypothetical protein